MSLQHYGGLIEQMPDMEGQIIGGVRLGAIIGRGALGAVYRGVDPKGVTLAVKIMEETPFLPAEVLKGILEGALATQRVAGGAKVVKVFSAGQEGSFYYLAMELFESGTLEKVITDDAVSVKQRLAISVSLARTLALVHAAGIIHGDLKPANVLMGKDRDPYLNDFYHASQTLRQRGLLGSLPQGTPLYMSPEQVLGKFISSSSDIYSFGVLCYELLTGASPYEKTAGTLAEMLSLIQDGRIVPPSSQKAGIDRRIEAVLMKLLEQDVEKRYRSMAQASVDLDACLKGGQISMPYQKTITEKLIDVFRPGKN